MPEAAPAPIILGADGKPISSQKKSFNIDPNFWKRGTRALELSAEVLEQPYAKHPFVYACCNAITMNLSRLPKLLFEKANKQKVIDDHSFLSLLNRPNELMSGTKIWEITFLSLLLPTTRTPGGQCFWVGIGKGGENYDFMSRTDLPFMLFPFNDSLFYPVKKDNSDLLFGWRLELPSGGGITYKTNEVLRFNFVNPYDLYKGLSPLAAAYISLLQDAKSAELNSFFFDNNASLGGTLTTEQKLTDNQAREMAVQWRQEYTGASKAGKIAVLHSGLEYDQIEATHSDMQFVEQRKLNREDIMAVYRVPKAEVSLYEDLNYATAVSADKSFWQKTLRPHDDMVLSVINESWLRFFESGKWRIKSDYSGIDALNIDYKDRIDQLAKLVEKNVPVEEAARLLGIPIDSKKYEWLKTVFVNGSMVTAEAIGDIPLTTAAPTPASLDKKSKKLNLNKNAEQKLLEFLDKNIDDRKTKIEEYFKRAVDPIENDYRKSLSKFFIRQRNLVLDAVDEYFKNKKSINKASDFDINPEIFFENLRSEDEILRGISEEYYDKEIKAQAKEMKDELGDLGNWDIDSEETQKLKKLRLQQLKGINRTSLKYTGDHIRKAIKDLPEDATVQEAAKAIKKSINQVYTIRIAQAKTIARTEIGTIASGVRFDIMEKENIEQHEWVSVLDEVTRETHGDINGQVRKLGDEFSNGLLFPLDPTGEPEEVINCRCVALPFKEGDHV